MASGTPQGLEGARGQTGEQGIEIKAGKRICANQLRGHGSIKYLKKGPYLSISKSNTKTTHTMG